MFGYDTYLSPGTWRYGSEPMRRLWSERERRRLMRSVWVALATAQHEAGLVSSDQLDDLRDHADAVDIERSHQIEKETRHDVMAEIRAYAEQAPVGGAILHWGATSADINDNVNALRFRSAAALIAERLRRLLLAFADKIEQTADMPTMAFTHIQPAEPTTVGYRFCVYAQDLLLDYRDLQRIQQQIRGKGFKGAVGTQASYVAILENSDWSAAQLEQWAMDLLDLPFYEIATQTYTRGQDWRIINGLAAIAASLHKFALDFRILQSPALGEWSEPFGDKQVGSTAMPFKRNPINMENVCSLARYVAAMPAVLWDNHSQAILERSLDDSANRRWVFPDAFLATDEMLSRTLRVVSEMQINEGALRRNFITYGPFAATERVLMHLVSGGADRQEAHEWIRDASLQAWRMLENRPDNPLTYLLANHPCIAERMSHDEVEKLMQAESHLGTAVDRARTFAQQLRQSCVQATSNTNVTAAS